MSETQRPFVRPSSTSHAAGGDTPAAPASHRSASLAPKETRGRAARDLPLTIACEECGERFKPTRKGHRFCSRRCSGRSSFRRWYKANREKESERTRRWREANREKVREWSRRWCEANREKVREKARVASRRWREANHEKVRDASRRCRDRARRTRIADELEAPNDAALDRLVELELGDVK